MSNKARLIGICGYRQSGKTTTAMKAIYNPLSWKKPLPIHLIGFASPITEMLSVIIRPEILRNKARWDEPLQELCGRSTRYAAETLGTEWGCDHIGNDIWTRIAFAQAEDVLNSGVNVIIDGIRKPHEYEEIRKRNGIMISFCRFDHVVNSQHETEKHIASIQAKCDHIIVNYDGKQGETIERFHSLLLELIPN